MTVCSHLINNNNPIKKATTNLSIEKAQDPKYGYGEKEAQVAVVRDGKTFLRKQKVGRKGSNVQYQHEREVESKNKELVEEFMRDIFKKRDPEGLMVITDEDKNNTFVELYKKVGGQLDGEQINEVKKYIDNISDSWNYSIRKNIIETSVKNELIKISPIVVDVSVNVGTKTYVRLNVGEKYRHEINLEFDIDKETKNFKLKGIGASGYTREIDKPNEVGELILAGDIASSYLNNTSSGTNGAIRNAETVLNQYLYNPEFTRMLDNWDILGQRS